MALLVTVQRDGWNWEGFEPGSHPVLGRRGSESKLDSFRKKRRGFHGYFLSAVIYYEDMGADNKSLMDTFKGNEISNAGFSVKCQTKFRKTENLLQITDMASQKTCENFGIFESQIDTLLTGGPQLDFTWETRFILFKTQAEQLLKHFQRLIMFRSETYLQRDILQ